MTTTLLRTPRRGGGSYVASLALVLAAVLVGLLLGPAVPQAHAATDVRLLQRDLAGLSYAPLSGVDGIYGSQTTASVRHFQSDNGLSVDGDAGPATMGALIAKVKQVQSKAGSSADGDYGPATISAVKSYQSSHRLDADGIAGPLTMAAMNIDRITSSGTGTSSDTKLLQRNLVGLGYLGAGGVDGVYGPATKDAVLAFQSDNSLEVDGIAGPQTDAALTAKVKQVQSKAGTSADGDYGPATTSAVKSYQSSHQLDADGIAGPRTMASMGIAREVGGGTSGGESGGTPSTPPLSGSTRDKIVQAARSQLGVTEWGNNCNPYGPCEAWCALFASWTWRQAGINFSTAFSGAFYYYGRDHGTLHSGLSDPQPGDAIVFGSGPQNTSTSVHVGIIEKAYADGTVDTIEGNSHNRVERRHFSPAARGAYAIISPAGA
ncbi:peptidoglycan-binding protein [Streptomyces beihaiensis]|uniref:Peptidoglycan-binding protein n=1 Tax=Streptomyces beihaiensis TaxID=2984495 RepID=A0ABT3U604_9ACTN|nr:peptidoglycan-binding protein [Streptomyces beihaiensis]MCX3064081.1 peptidoglycan-binding protein [Streptomyces beihaiensis]